MIASVSISAAEAMVVLEVGEGSLGAATTEETGGRKRSSMLLIEGLHEHKMQRLSKLQDSRL